VVRDQLVVNAELLVRPEMIHGCILLGAREREKSAAGANHEGTGLPGTTVEPGQDFPCPLQLLGSARADLLRGLGGEPRDGRRLPGRLTPEHRDQRLAAQSPGTAVGVAEQNLKVKLRGTAPLVRVACQQLRSPLAGDRLQARAGVLLPE